MGLRASVWDCEERIVAEKRDGIADNGQAQEKENGA
jgi:hypothetical protein